VTPFWFFALLVWIWVLSLCTSFCPPLGALFNEVYQGFITSSFLSPTHLHLSMRQNSLFCFVTMKSTKLGCFKLCSWYLWKAFDKEWCTIMDHDVWSCNVKVLEYWMNFSLKIKLNHNCKFQKNWDVPLELLERSQRVGFNGIYLVRFGLKMGEILNFKWFIPLQIQINHKKPGFGMINQLKTLSHLKVYHSIQVWWIGLYLWYCWKDFDEQDSMEFIL